MCNGSLTRSPARDVVIRSGPGSLEPPEPVRLYERACPGDTIHIDINKLGRLDHPAHRVTGGRTSPFSGRGVGWEFVHVCIDASRMAVSQILPDELYQSSERRAAELPLAPSI